MPQPTEAAVCQYIRKYPGRIDASVYAKDSRRVGNADVSLFSPSNNTLETEAAAYAASFRCSFVVSEAWGSPRSSLRRILPTFDFGSSSSFSHCCGIL